MSSNQPDEEQASRDGIPLQDLSPTNELPVNRDTSPGRARRSFQRTRSLFQNRGSSPSSPTHHRQKSRGSPFGRKYEAVPDVPDFYLDDPFVSSSAPRTTNVDSTHLPVPQITTDVYHDDEHDPSTVFDHEGGMNVDMETMREGLMEVLENEVSGSSWLPGHARIGSRNASPGRMSTSASPKAPMHQRGLSVARAEEMAAVAAAERERERQQSNASQPESEDLDGDYFGGYSGPINYDDSDTVALTDPTHLQPISGAFDFSPSSTGVSPRGRLRSLSGGKQPSMSSGRLGDDLNSAEMGLNRLSSHVSTTPSSHARKKSLVPGGSSSPVRRVSVAVQNISQRVVNLSNDPNANIVRRPSTKSLKGRESPPDLPHITFADDVGLPKSPTVEKVSVVPKQASHGPWHRISNPLRGKSLRIFSSNNPIRIFLCDLLVHPFTEPFILLLIVFQTVLLTADSAKSVDYDTRERNWGASWTDWAMLAIFVTYTIEILARVVVSGFVINPLSPNDPPPEGVRNFFRRKFHEVFSPQELRTKTQSKVLDPPPTLLRALTNLQQISDGHPAIIQESQRARLARRAFLRHSFNRLDFVAVVSFWITFFMVLFDLERHTHLYIFRMMSCLRILRLLGITSGTAVILRSLKKAAPLMLNVSFLISFFWLLFGIIGVQSFKSSFRRQCVWIDPQGIQGNYSQGLQFCGGYLNATTGIKMPYLLGDGTFGAPEAKGYICPQNSLCVEGSNPYAGTVSFDNIFQSMELVFVVISSNTFSDLMSYTSQSDYFASSLFFVFGIVILTFWLMNLLVAVITSSFQVIREEEGKQSAFTTREEDDDDDVINDKMLSLPKSRLRRLYEKTEYFWIFAIAFSLFSACFRNADMEASGRLTLDTIQLVVTFVLCLEMVLRVVADGRNFHKSSRNWVDLGLAIATAIIELPVIKSHSVTYAWLTIFQILRIYRLVLLVPVTRNLLSLVLGNAAGLLNLIFFLAFITFLCSIFAVQLLRGDIPDTDPNSGNTNRVTFENIYNSILGMYQILSTENWTVILYSATQYQTQFNVAWISAVFFIAWFILSNAVILNMFIAVIQENFDVTEDEKRVWQIKSFLQRKDNGTSSGTLSLSSLFGFGARRRERDAIEFGNAGVELLSRKAVVDEFLEEQTAPPTLKRAKTIRFDSSDDESSNEHSLHTYWQKLVGWFKNHEDNPFHSDSFLTTTRGELAPTALAQELTKSREKLRRAQREYLLKYPKYNVSLHIFKPQNPIRRICQRIVGPSHGNIRFDGAPPYKPVWYAFSGFVYCSIVTMVVIACITTPIYQKVYFQTHGLTLRNWFLYADIGFAALFTLEATIKIIADGLYWTPNAYLRNVWGIIDCIVLITLWISVGTSFANKGEVARAVGAFKALRALRLLNVSDSARETFNSILYGARKLISAAFVSLSLLIPFAIYGLNLFSGQLISCNDSSSITFLSYCIFEYPSSPFNWNVLAPRVADNAWYSFDSFPSSLFILFQIVSQEGWIDVMWNAMSITGVGMQPQNKAAQVNSIFFVAFNLLGSVFVLTLFVSVFIRNYTEQTGVAFLTAEQRSWLELRKILRQVRPSKRPVNRPDERWKAWCYNRAVRKHGRWNGFLTTVLLLHLLLLIIEYYPSQGTLDVYRDLVFLAFTLIYMINIVVRIVGLTWKRYIKSRWDIYGLLVVTGTLGCTVAMLIVRKAPIFVQFQKLFLVLDTLLLIPRNNQLDQLFKTAAASFSAIANLMITWLVLFLVYAIALTQTFGLTRIGPNGSGNLNLRTVPNALIVLFRSSCGEGWDQIMDDFSVTWPNCVASDSFFDSDCGSKGYARFLFISWNIVSMYIFVSMFVSLIFESFSYVFQQAGNHQAVSREDIRKFKQAWSKYDPEGLGYLSEDVFPRLLKDLTGIFTMRIYDDQHTVRAILADCRVDKEMDKTGFGVDIDKLNRKIADIDVLKIREQRRLYSRFYEECLVSMDKDYKGVTFVSVLITLAHYKIVSDTVGLRLEEFLRRRAKLSLVEDQIKRNTVRSFFQMLFDIQRYNTYLRTDPKFTSKNSHHSSVPQIFVQSESTVDVSSVLTLNIVPVTFQEFTLSPTTPRGSPTASPRESTDSRRLSEDKRDTLHAPKSPKSPLLPTTPTTPTSPKSHMASSSSPGENPTRAWNTRRRGQSLGTPMHNRGESNISPQDVMEAINDSSWGVAIRRSVTRKSVDYPRRQPSNAGNGR